MVLSDLPSVVFEDFANVFIIQRKAKKTKFEKLGWWWSEGRFWFLASSCPSAHTASPCKTRKKELGKKLLSAG